MKLYLLILLLICAVIRAQDGIIKTYHQNGNPRSEVSYVNNILDGVSFFFFPNGNVQSEKNYSNGILNGIIREYYDNGLLKLEYSVKDGIKDGTVRSFYENGSVKEIAIYSGGLLFNIDKFEKDKNHIALPEDYLAGNRQREILQKKLSELICDADICPVPIGGLQKIQENLVYPEHALLYGLEGKVVLVATIDAKGNVTNTDVLIHLGLGCDEAAQDAVKKTKFIPGQKDNKIVESQVTIYVEFKIDGAGLQSANKEKDNSFQVNQNKLQVNKDFISTEVAAKNDFVQHEDLADSIFTVKCDSDICPKPEMGTKEILRNLTIPMIAKRLKLKGTIEISAVVDKYGYVKNTIINKGVGFGCDQAFESALMKTKFKPAVRNAQDVDSTVNIIFLFDYNY